MDAASIEQMNKVRVSLGMAPLPVPGKDSGPQFKQADDSESEEDDMSTLDKRQAAADSNWRKLEDERIEKLEREKRKAAAKKARDMAARYAKMEGKGLGEADEEELDMRSWLLGQKKRQKKIDRARKMEEELAEREREAQQQQAYTSKDLAGVKVGHEAAAFEDATDEQVLTLKDANIGDESEDDELENAELKAQEKLEENLRLKKKRPDYDPTEQGEERGLLSKYDDEIGGKKQKRFTLDGEGNTVEAARKQLDGDGEVKSKGVKISLDMFKDDAPISDYVDPSTIKVKKPKKKKEKKTRQKAVDEDDIFPDPASVKTEADAMEVDGVEAVGHTASKKRAYDFEDDDDLQAKLAESRRQALKKRKKMDATELAKQMRDEMPVDEEQDEDGGLIMDETSEFVANLKRPEAPAVKVEHNGTPQPATVADGDEPDEDGDTTMAQSYAEAADEEERRERIKRETSGTPAANDGTATGLENEDVLSGTGTGAALNMLRKRGLVSDADSAGLSHIERQRAQFLADKKSLIDEYDLKARQDREADRQSGRWDRMSNRDRDAYARQQNEAREAYIAKLLADMFNKQYRPNVQLKYHDEHGRELQSKEAFKQMSHAFHGKGSGKQKTEKRLKKIEDEKRGAAKGVLHAGGEGGFMDVQGREGRKQKQAGVRLQ